jgi:hypothetical protein
LSHDLVGRPTKIRHQRAGSAWLLADAVAFIELPSAAVFTELHPDRMLQGSVCTHSTHTGAVCRVLRSHIRSRAEVTLVTLAAPCCLHHVEGGAVR